MTLENLLAIQRLMRLETNRDDIQRLLASAQRNLEDARVTAISVESRFDAAYKCILQIALCALRAHGYRPATGQLGHHQTALQSLVLTLGVDARSVLVLDTLRKQRNISDYDGSPVSPAAVEESLRQATLLLQRLTTWLREHHPEMC